MLILFILSIGFVSASTLDSNLDENKISDDISDASESDIVSTDSYVDLNSNSADTENLNAAEEDEVLKANVKPSGNTFNDIQKVVNNAKANDVIELSGTYSSSGKAISVKKSLTFNGADGTTLDGKKLSGIFHITQSATVTFNNIKFANAIESGIFADSDGYVDKVKIKLIINNCNFANNYNKYYGGAIYAFTSGICKVSNSNFTANYVKDPEDSTNGMAVAGAIYAYNLDLTNCNFIKNNAQSEGGAIYFESSANVTSSLFKENYVSGAARRGGAISSSFSDPEVNDEWGVKLALKDSTFLSNYLKNPGSSYAYFIYGGAVSSQNINVLNCVFKNNSATYNGGKGGAVYGTDIDVKNSLFEGNIANYAGAIYSDNLIGEDTYNPGVLKISNCSFISNKEWAVRASKTIISNGNSVKTFKYKALDNNLKPISLFKATTKKLSTSYYSGKTIKIKVLTLPSKITAKKLLLLVVAKSSKKKYSIPIKTNSKGIATLKASRLNAGYYRIYVYETFLTTGSDPGDEVYYKVPGVLSKTTLKVTKAKTIVKAPKVKFRYKKSRYFKLTLKHKVTKKVMSGIKLKLRVYTGKKFKTYYVKTNKKGVAKLNTKKLKRGKHKVKILSRNKNVIVSKTSSIRIR